MRVFLINSLDGNRYPSTPGNLPLLNLRNGSPAYAKKLLKQIRIRIDTLLVHHPEASVLTNFPNTRMAALGHFSLFYKKIDNRLIINAFWDNRQDPKKLKELLDKPK